MNIRLYKVRPWPLLALIVFACTSMGSLAAQMKLRPLLDLAGQTADPGVSPDGKSIAFFWQPTDVEKWGIYIAPTSGGVPSLFAGADKHGVPRSPVWSGDGKWIAFLRSDTAHGAALFVKSQATEEERFLGLVCNGGEIWTADSDSVIAPAPKDSDYTGQCEMDVYPIQQGAHAHTLGVSGTFPALSRDGKTLAFVNDHEIRLLSLTSDGRAIGTATTLVQEPLGIVDPIWAASSNEILYILAVDHSRIRCVAARPGSIPRDVGKVDGNLASLATSSKGDLFAGMEIRDSSLWTIDLRIADPRPVLLRQLPWNVGPAKVSPDARKLAYSVTEGGSSDFYISNLDGTESRRLFTIAYDVEQLSWSPDGAQIAVIAQSGRAQLEPSRLFVASAVDGSPRRLLGQFKDVHVATWSSDGRALLVSANLDGTDAIWNVKLADGSLTRITQGTAMEVQPSPDGRIIYLRRSPFNLFRIPLGGGTEEQVASGVLQYVVGKDELYIERQDSNPPATEGLNLYRLDLVLGMPQFIAHVGFLASSIQLSGDRRLIYLERHDPPQEHLVEVQGWH